MMYNKRVSSNGSSCHCSHPYLLTRCFLFRLAFLFFALLMFHFRMMNGLPWGADGCVIVLRGCMFRIVPCLLDDVRAMRAFCLIGFVVVSRLAHATNWHQAEEK